MIISHKYKYLFVALPRTGSTAISQELLENYDGERILSKHATYYDFLKVASDEEKRYFVFSCIRNPLDEVVSVYFQYKTDHNRWFSDPVKLSRQDVILRFVDKRRFVFARSTQADFSSFFMRFYKVPYNKWASLSHARFDFIIRFENLPNDFAKVLELIGIELKRPLPVVNKTGEKGGDFLQYYTPETIGRAKRVFGPYMKQWGYEFPPEWGDTSVPWWNQMEFQFLNIFRSLYWRYLRSRISPKRV